MSETFKVYAYHSNYCDELGGSMHLALARAGGAPLVLNGSCGVLFPNAQLGEGKRAGTTKIMIKPWVFRLGGGGFGVVALRRNIGQRGASALEEGRENRVLVFRSEDLVSYEELGFVEASPPGTAISDVSCRWEGEGYVLTMETDRGRLSCASTDLARFGPAAPGGRAIDRVGIEVDDAAPACALELSEAEYRRLVDRLAPLENVGVAPIEAGCPAGGRLELPEAELIYGDGSRRRLPVDWEPVDGSSRGVRTVRGRVKPSPRPFPVMGERGDPMAIRYRGSYCYMATDDEGGQLSLKLRRAETIGDIASAEDRVILSAADFPGPAGCFWAPELHEIEGSLFLFFAVGGPHWYTVQSHVMELLGDDPAEASHWSKPRRCERKDGSVLIEDGISLDMTVLIARGGPYALWAQRPIGDDLSDIGSSDLYIARIDPREPWRQTSEATLLRRPSYAWERAHSEVIEGPFALRRGGELFVTYAAALVDHTYCVGLLRARDGGDLLDPRSWKASNYPILHRWSVPGQIGAGHNSFVKDERGEDILMIHAIPFAHYRASPSDSRRYPAFCPVHWDAAGCPRLDMTEERELSPAFESVEARLRVE
jgi:GH43 family beta-xylosidase